MAPTMELLSRRVLVIVAVVAIALGAAYVIFLRPSGHAPPLTYTHRDPISITSNDGFNSTNGVIRGSGSSSDPYIIEGWEIGPSNFSACISIMNTDAHFQITKVHLTHASRGVFFSSVDNGRVDHSIIDNMSVGATIATSDTCAIVNNDIRDCGIGLQIMESNNLNLGGNHFKNNQINIQKPSLPWELTWVGTALCLAVVIPLAIVVIAAAYIRMRNRRRMLQ